MAESMEAPGVRGLEFDRTALILNRPFRGSGIFLMAVMMPWAVASVVAGVFWRFIFDTHFGIINGILIGLGMIDKPVVNGATS